MSCRQLRLGEAMEFLNKVGVDKHFTEADLEACAPMVIGMFLEGSLVAVCTMWAPGKLLRGSKKVWTVDACYVAESPNTTGESLTTIVEYLETLTDGNMALLVNHKDITLLVAGLTNGFTRWLNDIDEYTLYGYTTSRPYLQVDYNPHWKG